MRVPESVRRRLFLWASGKIVHEKPDFVIGYTDRDYLHRWYVIPRNRWFNIYLHRFLRSDDDRALHDHPWWNCSILLKGEYVEYIQYRATGYHAALRGLTGMGATWVEKHRRVEGHLYLRRAVAAHRVELMKEEPKIDMRIYDDGDLHFIFPEIPVITLFITGPKIREWGFHCPNGWRHWQEFVANSEKRSAVGKGCE